MANDQGWQSAPDIYLTFTYPCRLCGGTVQVTDGIRDPRHPCPEDDDTSLVVEGPCAGTWPDGSLVGFDPMIDPVDFEERA